MITAWVKALEPGRYVKQYRIEALLATGGSSYVYRVSQETGAATYIMKECVFSDPALQRSPEGELRVPRQSSEVQSILHGFLREARWLSCLPPSYFPQLIDCFSANNTAYLVLDDPQGRILPHALYEEAPWHSWLEEVIDAMEILHAQGILHLDIKPENVVICPNHEVRLIDLSSSVKVTSHPVTVKESPVSQGFAAPEQYEQYASLTQATDVYALGALVFYCLNRGMVPQAADTRLYDDALGEWLNMHCRISAWHALADACLKHNPVERPQNIAQVRAILCRF